MISQSITVLECRFFADFSSRAAAKSFCVFFCHRHVDIFFFAPLFNPTFSWCPGDLWGIYVNSTRWLHWDYKRTSKSFFLLLLFFEKHTTKVYNNRRVSHKRIAFFYCYRTFFSFFLCVCVPHYDCLPSNLCLYTIKIDGSPSIHNQRSILRVRFFLVSRLDWRLLAPDIFFLACVCSQPLAVIIFHCCCSAIHHNQIINKSKSIHVVICPLLNVVERQALLSTNIVWKKIIHLISRLPARTPAKGKISLSLSLSTVLRAHTWKVS